VGALGVVYGDIGTSPLYAVRECFHSDHAVPAIPENIYGVLSLIFWALTIVICIKYLGFVMRADNEGEGGILALTSLMRSGRGKGSGGRALLVAIGLFGAALFYGDGMITPAISVLSAVEGLGVATPFFDPWIVPITIVILIALFLVQSHGTTGIGAVFGPITFIWFTILAILGISQIVREPSIFMAVNPLHGIHFMAVNPETSLYVLGAVFLVVTGGEALYADMGHFGSRPIRLTWYVVVLPALLLNYFGQGSLLLQNPEAATNPFYRMAPSWALYPLVILATCATVIASQAVISGAFSLTRQAIQLGYCPRLRIDHKSEREIGQIYIPTINWILMLACIALVIGFKTSSNLAAAYGIAVTTTMVITTFLLYIVARERWNWNPWLAGALVILFLVVDLSFFSANLLKIAHGGWFPLLVATFAFILMSTWKRGRKILDERLRRDAMPSELFIHSVAANPPTRVPGTAIFMFRNVHGTPTALLHSLKHYKVLHETVVLLSVINQDVPYVPPEERSSVEELGQNVYRMILRYGFMDDPDIPAALREIDYPGIDLDPARTSYFLGRETIIATPRPGMAMWREHLFAWMSRNARGASDFFRLPPNRVVELGAQIEI